jgi:hypothetical protein
MTDDPKHLSVPLGTLLKVRGQLQTARATIAEMLARERAAQLALIQDHRFTISAICVIYGSPRGPL